MNGLFQLGNYVLASGLPSCWKLECDALGDDDWECLAYLGSRKVPQFGSVVGVPRGGLEFARAMEKYKTVGPRLVVDDVFTTGGTLMKFVRPDDLVLVAFARSAPPAWVRVICSM